MRKMLASKEMSFEAKKSSNKKIEIFSFWIIDKSNCECQSMMKKLKEEFSKMTVSQRLSEMEKKGHLTCPRSKVGMNRYVVTCKVCGEVQGYCWATDSTLKDWCDFHYIQWTDGKEWHGCFTPHISPITEELCLECCCGEDTRDFRANMTLGASKALAIEMANSIGREFGKQDSKFSVRKVDSDVIPFKKG